MCILPTFIQKRIFEDCILEIDCWFRKFDQWPLSEVPGQMIAMLRMSDKTNDRDAGGLICRKLSRSKRGSYKKMIKNEPFVAINNKWLMDFLEVHFAQSMGAILSGVRKKIGDVDRASPTDLDKCYIAPEVLPGWLLGKKHVLIGDGQGLTDGELIKAFRSSNILNTYQFRN